MSSFHFCLSAAKNLSSFQLLPASLMTDLLQLFLDLPLFLLPWGFHSRAAFDISPSSFLNVWPIHLNFLFLISRFISSWSVTLHKSLVKDKAYGNNPHSEDNVEKKMHWGYIVLALTSGRGVTGGASGAAAPGSRIRGLTKWWEKLIFEIKKGYFLHTANFKLLSQIK